jgi:hypothetical protein
MRLAYRCDCAVLLLHQRRKEDALPQHRHALRHTAHGRVLVPPSTRQTDSACGASMWRVSA